MMWTPELDQQIVSMQASGVSLRQIAERVGAPKSTTQRRLTRLRAPPKPQAFIPEAPIPTSRWIVSASHGLLSIALAEALTISVECGEVLAVLLAHPCERIGFEHMRAAIGLHRPVKQGALYERIRMIRKLLGRDVIGGYRPPEERFRRADDGTEIGESRYYLTNEGMAICTKALARMSERLVPQAVASDQIAEPVRSGQVARSHGWLRDSPSMRTAAKA